MSNAVLTTVDLARVRANTQRVVDVVGPGVQVIGVVKADAYGLGAVSVADAINDLVSGWYVFEVDEAVKARLFEMTSKRTIVAVVPEDADMDMLKAQGIRPAVWTPSAARRFASLDPVLSVDTGMQRFACPPEGLSAMFDAYPFTEAFTHASRPEQADRLLDLTASRTLKRHAAASTLLEFPRCRLDAVRPGVTLYAGAARVTTRLVDARESRPPVGYTGFTSSRHGVIKVGYSNGLRRGPCIVNGRRQQILEVGMQSSYVSLEPTDRTGDEVVLLGDGLTATEIGASWNASAYETLLRLTKMGEKVYA